MEKRESCRAIIITNNKLVTMYREKDNRVYYTFPGGGVNEGEELTACVVREVEEEFGMVVKPIKQVYTYENDKTIQHFFVCEWISGDFASGTGEEFQADRNKGVYIPTMLDLSIMANQPLMPPEVKDQLLKDYDKTAGKFYNSITYIKG